MNRKIDYQTPSLRRNAIYNIIVQITSLMVPFITTPYVSRVLGASNIGKYSYAYAMVTYFLILASLGTATYAQRRIAFSRDNKEEFSRAFWEVVLFRLLFSCIALLLYYAYLYATSGINLINIIVSVYIINVAVDITWLFQGIEKFKNVMLRVLVIRVISLIGIFLFVRTKDDVWVYALVLVVSILTGNLSMWLLVPPIISKVKYIRPLSCLKDSIKIFIPTIAIQVYTVLDKSMINWITHSNYSNGCYEQSEKIARLAITVITAIGTVILPRVAYLYKKNELQAMRDLVYKGYRVVWFLSIPMTFGLISISSLFIPIFLGTGFSDSIGLLKVFSLLIIVVSLAYVTGLSYLISTNQEIVYTYSVSVSALLNFIANMVLIPKYGAFGAAIASVLAELIGVTIQISYCCIKNQLEVSKIFLPSGKYWISGLIMFISINSVKKGIGVSFGSLIVLVFIGAVIYISTLFILRDKFLIESVNHLISLTHSSLSLKINKD